MEWLAPLLPLKTAVDVMLRLLRGQWPQQPPHRQPGTVPAHAGRT